MRFEAPPHDDAAEMPGTIPLPFYSLRYFPLNISLQEVKIRRQKNKRQDRRLLAFTIGPADTIIDLLPPAP